MNHTERVLRPGVLRLAYRSPLKVVRPYATHSHHLASWLGGGYVWHTVALLERRTMFHNKDGSLTHYALACGYVQSETMVTEDGREFDLRLSYNGCTYDVDIVPVEGPRDWTLLPNGVKLVSGWAQFDS